MFQDATDPLSVLLIENNPDQQKLFHELTNELSFSIDLTVTCGTVTVPQELTANNFDLVFINHDPDHIDCYSFYDLLKEEGFNIPPTILMTEAGTEAQAADWFRFGGDGYLTKEELTATRLEQSILTALETPAEYKRIQDKALLDPRTGLWGPRYLIEKVDSLKENSTSEDFIVGAGLIEVRGLSEIRKNQGIEARDSLLRSLAMQLRNTIAHTGICGHYFENTFWVLFQKTQVNLMTTKLTDVIEGFDWLLQNKIKNSTARTLSAGVISRSISDNFSRLQRKLDFLLLKASNSTGSRLIMNSL